MLAIVPPQPRKRVIIAGERHSQTGSAYSPRSTGHCLVVKTVLDHQPPECVFAYVVVVLNRSMALWTVIASARGM